MIVGACRRLVNSATSVPVLYTHLCFGVPVQLVILHHSVQVVFLARQGVHPLLQGCILLLQEAGAYLQHGETAPLISLLLLMLRQPATTHRVNVWLHLTFFGAKLCMICFGLAPKVC